MYKYTALALILVGVLTIAAVDAQHQYPQVFDDYGSMKITTATSYVILEVTEIEWNVVEITLLTADPTIYVMYRHNNMGQFDRDCPCSDDMERFTFTVTIR